ncbi:MAG: geranylgeranyl pyrophosphate synthase [Methylobacterium sp.]|nr:MAG: geranylgeranyl pyrophosphate synthase [Methylobacterium sp.]
MQAEFRARLERHASAVETCLASLLSPGKRPERLVAAMRHAVFAGGKRLRPYLVIESARLFGLEGEGPLRVAAALEAVHCYSLVHDDLPAMDNDDLRRGQPTAHIAFDEATAILAGDALLTMAFAIVADRATAPRASTRAKIVAALAEASGIDGMVGGQMLDLAAEGRFATNGKPPRQGLSSIRHLQALKTGALIRFAAEAGALLAAPVPTPERRALKAYGEALGFAFQIRDDLLDIEGEAAVVGKAVAKDAKAGKATLVSLMGLDGARARLASVTGEAIAGLEAAFGSRAGPLADVLIFNRDRDR